MILINDLHITANPRLIFMTNDLENKGRSNKSYTIRVVNDSHNDYMLSNVFSSTAQKINKFDAYYRIADTVITGILQITSIDKQGADALFVSGNGSLWNLLADSNLRNPNLIDFDHRLTYNSVVNSETNYQTTGYVYDLVDRGAFKQEVDKFTQTKVDITERFPAYSIKKLITAILLKLGVEVLFSSELIGDDVLDDLVLLYTQEIVSRNSSGFQKNAVFNATFPSNQIYSTVVTGGTSSPTPFEINKNIVFNTVEDNPGNNYNPSTGVYKVNEGGTYRFVSPYSFQIMSDNTITGAEIEIGFKRGLVSSDRIYYETTAIGDGKKMFLSGVLDTKWIGISGGDVVLYVKVTGNVATNTGAEIGVRVDHIIEPVSAGVAWPSDNIPELIPSRFYAEVVLNTGANSNVKTSDMLPDMSALDFLSKVFKYLNIYAYYTIETKTLELIHSRNVLPTSGTIYPVDVIEQVEEPANYILKFNTDKQAAPDDIYFDEKKTKNYIDIKFDLARTYLTSCYRVLRDSIKIPTIWNGNKDPRDWAYAYDPPEFSTKANLRIMKYDGIVSGDYIMTFGGVGELTNETNVKQIPTFSEPNILEYHRYDLTLEGCGLTCIAKIDVLNLKNNKYFKYPLNVDGYGMYYLIEAEQINGDLYKLKLIK